MSKSIKLIIVEGEKKEKTIIDSMISVFFNPKGQSVEIIEIPAGQNIYMLYEILKKDEFETDLVEILRERIPGVKKKLTDINRDSIDEIFMFFDFDIHQNNLRDKKNNAKPEDVIQEMLDYFDNETENGKIYISYPMAEALYDYMYGMCETLTGCYVEADNSNKYKSILSQNSFYTGRHLDISVWKNVLSSFILRIKCMYEIQNLSLDLYRKKVSPKSLFKNELNSLNKYGQIFVISGFPQFLFDYYKEPFWNSMARQQVLKYTKCNKRE